MGQTTGFGAYALVSRHYVKVAVSGVSRAQLGGNICNARRGQSFCVVSGGRSEEKILLSQSSHGSAAKNLATLEWVTRFVWYMARTARKMFLHYQTDHQIVSRTCKSRQFTVSGARGAEKMLLVQAWRAQREENFDNAKLGHQFFLVAGARSAKKIWLLQPWRAQRKEFVLQC